MATTRRCTGGERIQESSREREKMRAGCGNCEKWLVYAHPTTFAATLLHPQTGHTCHSTLTRNYQRSSNTSITGISQLGGSSSA
jgi:hypothetical protein